MSVVSLNTGVGNVREALANLERAIPHMSWFAAAGEPLTEAEATEALRFLDALGLGSCEILSVADWHAAKAVADDPNWDHAWWDAEENMRQALIAAGQERLSEEGLHVELSRITEASDAVHGAAAIAATRAGVADQALIKSAAGAATQACYQAALAIAADAGPDHAFAVKLRLFDAGRWPLGVVGGRYYLL